MQELDTGLLRSRDRIDERAWLANAVRTTTKPSASAAAYSDSRFGRECLLASQLVASGVPFVEIQHDGWDLHAGLWQKIPALAAEVDQGLSALLTDLQQSGALQYTTVVCLGEFGRIPSINTRAPAAGREHWAKNFCVLLAGAGIAQGVCQGETSRDGREILEGPISVAELFALLKQALGIDSLQLRNQLVQAVAPDSRVNEQNLGILS